MPKRMIRTHLLRPAVAIAALLALAGCVVAPPGSYYGAAPGYPAYAAAYPAYPAYYAAPPVGVVIGGGWGRGWGGGWGGGWHHWH